MQLLLLPLLPEQMQLPAASPCYPACYQCCWRRICCWQCNLIRVLLINAPGPTDPPLLQWANMVDWRGESSVFSVLFLLDHGANINAQDADGDALMHVYAAIQPPTADFKALVNSIHFAKADLLLRSGDGLTSLQVARAKLAELRADPDAVGDFIERQNFIVRVLAQLTPANSPLLLLRWLLRWMENCSAGGSICGSWRDGVLAAGETGATVTILPCRRTITLRGREATFVASTFVRTPNY